MSIWEMLKIEQTKDIEIIKSAYYALVESEALDKDSPMVELINMAYNSALYYATSRDNQSDISNPSLEPSNEDETSYDNKVTASESYIENEKNTVSVDDYTKNNNQEPLEFETVYYNSSGIDFYNDIEDSLENNKEDTSIDELNNIEDIECNIDILSSNTSASISENQDILTDLFFQDDSLSEIESLINYDKVTKKPGPRDKFTLLKDELSQAIRDNNIILADRAAYSAMMVDPNDSELLALLGQLNFMKGDFKKSKDFFDKAFTLDRTSQDSLFIYAKTLSARKNFIDACKIYREALDLDPKNLIIKYCLAVSYYHCKNYIESKILFDSIPLDSPYHFDIHKYQDSIAELITGKTFFSITEIPDIMKL